jgi:Trk K+ transport system NAD-binding subunit
MHDHVIVTGLGNIGYRVTNLLIESGEKIVAVEKNSESEFLTSIRGKVPVIFGSATQGDILAKAGAANARAIMALTDDDLVNLNILIDSKLVNPGIRTVARIFNRDIGEKAKDAFAIDSVLSTSQISAPTFAASAVHPDTVFAFNWEGHLFVMLDLSTADHTWIHSQSSQMVRETHRLYPLLMKSGSGVEFIHEGQSFTGKERILCIGLYEDIKKTGIKQ